MRAAVQQKIDEMRQRGKFSLVGVRLTPEEANEVISSLKSMRGRVSYFNLTTAQDSDALKIILEGLKNCPGLEGFTLAQIGQNHEELGSLVADVIASKAPLKRVSVATAKLGDAGATKIAQAAAEKPIEYLTLSTCQIGDAGAKEIGQLLKQTHSLRQINLSGNLIGSTGGIELAQGLMENTSLYDLQAHNNKFDNAAAHAFAETLAMHPTLCSFTFGSKVPETAEGRQAIEQAILSRNNPNFHGTPDGLNGVWEFCAANLAAFTQVLKSWDNLETKFLNFAQIDEGIRLIPGISLKHTGNPSLHAFEKWLDGLPTLNLSKVRSWNDVTKPNKNGYSILDNPRNWDHIEAIAEKLAAKGTPITLEQLQMRGRDGTPFLHYGLMHDAKAFASAMQISGINPCDAILTPMEDVITHLTKTRRLGDVFAQEFWNDATTQDLRQTVNCLSPEQKAQIPNLHSLFATLSSPSARTR